jgi:hypothetical protein
VDRRAATLSRHKTRDTGLLHQPLDALAPDPDIEAEAQLGMDPRRPIDATLRIVDLLDLLEQPRVLERTI